jgi:hypothetical protein
VTWADHAYTAMWSQNGTLSDMHNGCNMRQKPVIASLPYNHEILQFLPTDVEILNYSGGLRFFSFGDYREEDRSSLLSAIADCHAVGLHIKLISKIPELYAIAIKYLAAEDTCQISCDFELAGGYTAKYRDIMSNAITLEQAHAIKQSHPDLFQIRYVAINLADFKQACLDDRIYIVTRYHGNSGKTLCNIVEKKTTDVAFYGLIRGSIGKVLGEFTPVCQNIITRNKQLDCQQALQKTCCQTGSCFTCRVSCGKRG